MSCYRRNVVLGIVLAFSISVFSQDFVPFNGMVMDITGKPVKGVKVWVNQNKGKYATSDKKGHFGLSDVLESDTLNLKRGKNVYQILVDGRKSIKIMMADSGIQGAEEDKEIADLGFGFVKRRESTEASSHITGEELLKTGQTDILLALRGLVPGLNIQATPAPGSSAPNVMLRGRTSFNLNTSPLYVVDGTPMETLSYINIHDVEYVEIQKTGSMWGSRGANGVILVKTKGGSR